MSIKDKFQNGINTVKHTTLGAVTTGVIVCTGINVLGVAGHVATPLMAEAHFGNDYSLKNRFKTAYCFDTPKEEKYYEYEMWRADYPETTRYIAHPIATYGVIAIGTLLGAAAGAATARDENEQRRKRLAELRQKCR